MMSEITHNPRIYLSDKEYKEQQAMFERVEQLGKDLSEEYKCSVIEGSKRLEKALKIRSKNAKS